MAKIKDQLEEVENKRLVKAEREWLMGTPLVRHSKEYTQALMRYNHPRHKEAMEIRAKYQKVDKGYSEVRDGEVNYYSLV